MKYLLFIMTAVLCTACNNEPAYDATGRFEATDVVISAESSGKILRCDTQEGMNVEKGIPLAIVDTMQFHFQRQQTSADLESLLASRPDIQREASALRRQIARQKEEKKRFTNLVADGAATTKQLDDINAELQVFEGRLDALLSQLGNHAASLNNSAAALRAKIRQMDDQMARCTVTSPISGTILCKYAERGEFVHQGQPLFKVADLNHIFLRSYFTSEQLGQISLGDSVKVIADFGGNKRFTYQGCVQWIASESEFTPKTIQTKDSRANLVYAVKIAVNNDGRLKIGFYGEVYL